MSTPEPDPFEDPGPGRSPVFTAQFSGDCGGCGAEFSAGDPVQFEYGGGGLVSVECCGEDDS